MKQIAIYIFLELLLLALWFHIIIVLNKVNLNKTIDV